MKNEAGKRINYKKDKDPKLYEKWRKRTHLKIQDTGEREDTKTVNNAQSFHKQAQEAKRSGHKNKMVSFILPIMENSRAGKTKTSLGRWSRLRK